MLLDLKISVLN